MRNQKGIASSTIIIILLIVIIIVGVVWYLYTDSSEETNTNATPITNTITNTNIAANINSVANVNTVANINTVSNTNTTEILPDYCESDDDCGTGGCSNQVCDTIADAQKSITTCEVQDWYQCLDLTSCGCNNNRCGWEQNEEYLSCMDEYAP